MTPADKRLEAIKRQQYAAHGLVRINLEDDCQRIFDLARTLGCDAWDLEVRKHASGYTVMWTKDGAEFPIHVDLGITEDPTTKLRTAIGATGSGVTATGRTYRHAATPETMKTFQLAVKRMKEDQEAAESFREAVTAISATGDDASATQLDRIEAKIDRLLAKYVKD